MIPSTVRSKGPMCTSDPARKSSIHTDIHRVHMHAAMSNEAKWCHKYKISEQEMIRENRVEWFSMLKIKQNDDPKYVKVIDYEILIGYSIISVYLLIENK